MTASPAKPDSVPVLPPNDGTGSAARPASPSDIVLAESPNRIRDHFGRRARYNPTKSLTALTRQLTQEYEDRFLVELVQNAYDAHAHGSRGGRVHVRLDERAAAGPVLYVANTGRPFDEHNFDGLTNVAQSRSLPARGSATRASGSAAFCRSATRPRSTPSTLRARVPASTGSASASPPTPRSG